VRFIAQLLTDLLSELYGYSDEHSGGAIASPDVES
jgi:hypothetical protein